MQTACVSVLLAAGALAPAASAAQTNYTLTRGVRIGAVEGPAALTRIAGVEFDRNGTVYIGQPQDYQVAVFRPTGELITRIARRGDGPGEIRALSACSVRRDTVWLSDATHRRLSLFSKEGRYLSNVTWREGTAYPQGRFADGSFWAGYLGVPPLNDEGVWRLLRYDSAGRETGLIALAPGSLPLTISIQGTGWVVPRALRDGPVVLRAAGDSVLVMIDRRASAAAERRRTFSITWVGLSGDTLLRRSFRYTPQPFESGYAERLATSMAAGTRHASNSAVRQQLRTMLSAVTHAPPVQDAIVGTDDSIWFITPPAGDRPTRVFRVNPRGELIGAADLPRGTRLAAATHTSIWVIERDANDVEFLVSYTFAPSSR